MELVRPKRTRPRTGSDTRAQRDSTRPISTRVFDPLAHARDAAAIELLNVVAERDHVAMLAERGEESVVLERKMSEHGMQVNARFMSSCVSNSQRDFASRDDESARSIVTRS